MIDISEFHVTTTADLWYRHAVRARRLLTRGLITRGRYEEICKNASMKLNCLMSPTDALRS